MACPIAFRNSVIVKQIRVVFVIAGKRRNSKRYLIIAKELKRKNAKK